jgi:hypothetical protein
MRACFARRSAGLPRLYDKRARFVTRLPFRIVLPRRGTKLFKQRRLGF